MSLDVGYQRKNESRLRNVSVNRPGSRDLLGTLVAQACQVMRQASIRTCVQPTCSPQTSIVPATL